MSENKIPKIIHYCWFGGKPLPESVVKCINSWKKHMPDYEIKRWDESNYDVNKNQYMKEAYQAKKYGFVADYFRFDVLYQYGGIYFDTDVEMIRPIYDIVEKGPFLPIETGNINKLIASKGKKHLKAIVAPGLGFAITPKLPFFAEMLEVYEHLHFLTPDGKPIETTICKILTDRLVEKTIQKNGNIGYCEGIYLYPPTYFNPKGKMHAFGKIKITKDTRTIHHYDVSWKNPRKLKVIRFFRNLIERKYYKNKE